MKSVVYFCVVFILFAIPVTILYTALFGIPDITSLNILLTIVAFFASIPIHELIHGITCAYVSQNNYQTIHYGINLKNANAYCSFDIPISNVLCRNLVTIMPCIVLAVIPLICGFWLKSIYVCLFAVLNFAGASSDMEKCLKSIIATHKK